jgi:hypothetical protein
MDADREHARVTLRVVLWGIAAMVLTVVVGRARRNRRIALNVRVWCARNVPGEAGCSGAAQELRPRALSGTSGNATGRCAAKLEAKGMPAIWLCDRPDASR